MTVLLAHEDAFRLELKSGSFQQASYPVTLQAPIGTADRALCGDSSCPLERLLQCQAILSVTAVSPRVVHVEHVPLPGKPGELVQAALMVEVVKLLEAVKLPEAA